MLINIAKLFTGTLHGLCLILIQSCLELVEDGLCVSQVLLNKGGEIHAGNLLIITLSRKSLLDSEVVLLKLLHT